VKATGLELSLAWEALGFVGAEAGRAGGRNHSGSANRAERFPVDVRGAAAGEREQQPTAELECDLVASEVCMASLLPWLP
jgi:hypothetical protein